MPGERVRISGGETLAVYAADKIAKVRELRLPIACVTDEAEIASRKHRYEKSLSMIEAQAQTAVSRAPPLRAEVIAELPPQASGWK